MQGKGDPPDVDVECRLELFNTPGTEVAPRSDVITKYFKHLCHLATLIFSVSKVCAKYLLDILAQVLYALPQIGKKGVKIMNNQKLKGVEVKKVLYHYLEGYASGLKSYESSRYNCIPLTKFFGGMHINQVMPKHIEDYLKQRNMKPNTMKRELDIFRAAIQIGINSGLIETYNDDGDFSRDYKIADKVMGYISKFKPKAECRNMTPTHREFNAILGELPPEVRPFVQFAGLTAYRKTEIRKLQWKHVDLKKRIIYLPEAISKNAEDRKTPMYRELYRFVKNLYNFSDKNPESYIFYDKNEKPFHQWSMYRRWNSACKRAGVVDVDHRHKFVLHDCRRYGVRYLQEVKGFSPEITRLCFSGHKDIAVFERIYNKPTEDSIEHFIDVVTKR
jgi:integrase